MGRGAETKVTKVKDDEGKRKAKEEEDEECRKVCHVKEERTTRSTRAKVRKAEGGRGFPELYTLEG